jgi:MPBQ/MSBQ methyltransferase
VERATELASAAGLANCQFRVMDALNMEFPDNSFDFVWACESGEHMPDKKKYVQEMVRVLKPGGKIVIATWCQREATPTTPITAAEQKELLFLYEEWSHPYFVSIEEYARMLQGTGACSTVESDDWARYTIPAWRHSVWAGVWDPWPVVVRPHLWYKTIRDIVCLEKMHQAFDKGLMTYGMLKAQKAEK